jgi:pimeloyl-ACP methyl ester carboxylesterase
MIDFDPVTYHSTDGLALYARDYRSPGSGLPLLCLHGLTRNSADFEPLVPCLATKHRLVVPDQRGRGRSQHDPNPSNYQPAIYCNDMFRLLDTLGIERVVAIGTSMGGLMAMMMAAVQPVRIAGIVLNDVGPAVEREGLERIKGYVGRSGPVQTWDQAAAQARTLNGVAFPDFDDADWLAFARRTYVTDEAGVPCLAYDPAIAQPIAADETSAVPQDLWSLFDAILARQILVLRGELSDILSRATVNEMKRRKPDLVHAEIARRGHAPLLDEPEAVAAIQRFVASIV